MSEQLKAGRDRFQFVWWGFLGWQGIGFHRWEGSLASIYRYSVLLGPLEIRRWASRGAGEGKP